jgi:REP element-mobilizing transposase RayT/DNA-binding CsgD family transcriptional regulator
MARPLRIEFANAVYHVTSRGNGRQKILLDEQDNRKFLELFGKTLERFNWICHAYCLMVNHYHLMIETPDANLSKGMHHLNATFCQAHHKRHDTVGHLLQGRFKAIVVDRESYLLELARYVVLNPVRAGLVARPEDWPWSSYRATAGLPVSTPEAAPLLTTAWLLAQFGPDETTARRRYLEFVSSGIGLDSPWPQLQSQLFLGKETFIDKLRDAIPEKTAVKEIPKLQRYANRPQLKEIFSSGRSKKKRDEAIVASHVTYGYEQKEIANFLGIHYTTVSHVISRKRMGVRS